MRMTQLWYFRNNTLMPIRRVNLTLEHLLVRRGLGRDEDVGRYFGSVHGDVGCYLVAMSVARRQSPIPSVATRASAERLWLWSAEGYLDQREVLKVHISIEVEIGAFAARPRCLNAWAGHA